MEILLTDRVPRKIVAEVDAHEPDYQELIRSDRPQGPAALLAAWVLSTTPPRRVRGPARHTAPHRRR